MAWAQRAAGPVLLGLAAAAAFVVPFKENALTAKSRPARDGNIAIAEELCAARAKATKAAYDLFIARHPDHPLAETARKERARLIEGQAPKPR